MSYDSLPGLNYSTLKYLLASPKAYRWAVDHGYGSSKSKDLGTAFHCAVLEPERFETQYVANPFSGSTKAGIAFRNEAISEGKTILSQSEHRKLTSCAESIRAHDDCLRHLDSIFATEEPITWMMRGRQFKGRLDALGGEKEYPTLIDVKSCAKLSSFSFDAHKFAYPIQLALYHDGLEVLHRRPASVVILAVETAPPFDAACFVVPDAVLEVGRALYERALTLLGRCEERDEWPGAYPGETILVLPDRAYDLAHPDDEVEEWND